MAKEKIPAYIEPEDLSRARNAVIWLQAIGDDSDAPISLSSFCAEAVMKAVKEAETKYMRGRPFPARGRRQLPTGPRPGASDRPPGIEDDCSA
ncbi:hypothetical protein ACT1U9_32930 (plasmid) [Streptomyces sp. BR1]|uniref:hypothetical protein n=1 Tax=Streptomyces sp. BR1 TaxID=1592323 RepID=UPI00402BAA0A